MRTKVLALAVCAIAFATANISAQTKAQEVSKLHLEKWAAEEKLTPQELAQIEMVTNHVEAPAFTLKNLEGKDVSLSDFRGKWVILDFWGSWCRWCIKGIPEMISIYDKYHNDGLEIIGIDCNEPEADWRAGVEKYKLSWVNVYNPAPRGEGITAEYNVPGYPTKVIVDPEGKIFDIVVGEDPVFYELIEGIF